MIEVANLTKNYGRFRAVDHVSFSVRRGEIVGLLGPNGAGKTTIMRILACFLPPTAGKVRVAGLDVGTESLAVRRRLGYLPENAPLYPEMRVREYLYFRAGIRGLYGRRRRQRVRDAIERCELGDVRRQVIGGLSKGYRQRVGIADCLLHEPDVLILDEPTLGLDPNQIRLVRQLLRGLAGDRTVLLSTHILTEVEVICGRVLIMNRGRIVASDAPGELTALLRGASRFHAEIHGPPEEVAAALGALAGVIGVRSDGEGGWRRYALDAERGADVRPAVFEAVVRRGWALRELHGQRETLEDVFVAMTGKEDERS